MDKSARNMISTPAESILLAASATRVKLTQESATLMQEQEMDIRFTILLAAVALCLAPGDLLRVEQNDEAMGATFSVVLYGNDRRQMDKAADAAFDEVHRLDRLL